jgi:hypothetical protein
MVIQIPISKFQKPNKLQISKEEKFQTKKQFKNMPYDIDPPTLSSYGATSYEQIKICSC